MGECIDIFAVEQKQGGDRRGPVRNVQPLPGGILRVRLDTDSTIDIRLRDEFDKLRFLPLRNEKTWNNVKTDGYFVRWYRDGVKVVETTWGELLTIAVGPGWM